MFPEGVVFVLSMGRWSKGGQGEKLLFDFGLFGTWSHSEGRDMHSHLILGGARSNWKESIA